MPSTQWVVRAPTEGEEAASWTRSSSKGSEGPASSDVPRSLGAIVPRDGREVCSELAGVFAINGGADAPRMGHEAYGIETPARRAVR